MRERNAVTFTVSSRIFHCWSLEDNNSPLFFDSFRSLTGSESSFGVIFWFCGGYVQKKFRISWSKWLLCFSMCIFLFLITVSGGKNVGEFWNRQTFTVTNCQWYIWVLHWPFFHLRNPLLNRWHHIEVAVCEVTCQLPPQYGDCKGHGTFFAICVQLWRTALAAHVRSPAFVLVAYFTAKVLEADSFYHWV